MWAQIYFSLLLVNVIPNVLACYTTSCSRQHGWCNHHGSTFTLMDCDEDGIPDPVCSDTNGNFGVIGMSTGCRSKWPKEKCFQLNGKVCDRHKGWCNHGGATYLYQDCDDDGIPDPVCTDVNGRFGVIKSSQNCISKWPNEDCKAKGAPGLTCRRHWSWCNHGGSIFTLLDCDGDGIPDPICSDTQGRLGVIQSSKGCRSVWPKASCHTKEGNVCSRPKGWCNHHGSKFMFKDCDGDGIPDPVCTDNKGNLGVRKSSEKCSDNWPNDICFSPI